MSWETDWADARTPADRERQQLQAIARGDARRALAQERRATLAARWQPLRRRAVVHKISDHIMQLRHANRDVARWLVRLARVTAG